MRMAAMRPLPALLLLLVLHASLPQHDAPLTVRGTAVSPSGAPLHAGGAKLLRAPQRRQARGAAKQPLQVSRPWVIAHRGASGLWPEHTLEAYGAAIAAGADFVECDVVLTKDLHLVCRHEPNVNESTTAWQHFAHRAATYTIDGEASSGIFAHDLTLEELRSLRAVQRLPFRDQSHNGRYHIATLEEFLDVVEAAPRVVGIYPEVKSPSYHNALPQMRAANTTIEAMVLAVLQQRGYTGALGSTAWLQRPAFIQCFEVGALRWLAAATQLPLVLLLGGWPGWVTPDTGQSHEEITSDESLDHLTGFLAGMGPWKGSLYAPAASTAAVAAPAPSAAGVAAAGAIEHGEEEQQGEQQHDRSVPADAAHADMAADASFSAAAGSSSDGGLVSNGLVARLQARGLQVHPYTLRDEPHFVPGGFGGDVRAEFWHLFWREGVNAGFADWPATLYDWLTAEGPRLQQWGSGFEAPAAAPPPRRAAAPVQEAEGEAAAARRRREL